MTFFPQFVVGDKIGDKSPTTNINRKKILFISRSHALRFSFPRSAWECMLGRSASYNEEKTPVNPNVEWAMCFCCPPPDCID
ncbi:hypothetical protein THIOM_002187 [Candidatus Thiomargarita nelsonii]|uniref:Uncharacterized protein n=1 Tax=Candidatus Thiomargarita nelsonii TaxID=1003181 RepID=A0A176S1Z2_9GAMM|nr:hypothetical protein THIOM_002187 [Candidatus Thiomargarita nelsonii]